MSKSANPPSENRSSFNPFQAWLGFPPGRIPDNYYALFGVPLFEPDTKLIAQLADNMLAHVRQIRPGDHVTEWTELLDTIRNAKDWLCDPQKKKIYDRQLEAGKVTSLHFVWPVKQLEESPLPPADEKRNQAAAGGTVESVPAPTTARAETVSGMAEIAAPQDGVPLSPTKWLSLVGRLAAIVFLVLSVIVAYGTLRPRVGWVSVLLPGPSRGNNSNLSSRTGGFSVAHGPDEVKRNPATEKADISGMGPQREKRLTEPNAPVNQPPETRDAPGRQST
ncbi:MAG: hypothetical protein H5U08_16335, partial [Thermogutta sp.]|uniref:hypothetical protein n=1 Tax=Thermogutta sp. TaxID=1962930 RepID=UPI00199017E4